MLKNWPSHTVNRARARLRGAFLLVGAVAATLGLISAPITPASAQSPALSSFTQVAQPNLGSGSNLTSGYGQNTSSCEIETVGWIICPVMRSIAKLADYGFAFINQNFLKIEYGISNSESGVYKAWEIMRNVANALFVLAFMGIVYAQMTGRSAGGYNIKRMLPRLVIGAILVNISYFVCVVGIEISNIIGGSILAIMQQISDQIGPAAMTLSSAQNGFDDSRLSDITSSILTKSGTVWILLAPVAAVTVSIAIICAAGLVLLIMRKVVVSMLLLVSPLMFVAYLLPNTEHYFQKWLRLFFQLLLLYPVIAFLLGTGQIISATIINVGSGSDSNYRVRDDSYNARNGGSGSATTDLAAAGAAVLPLLGTWFLLQSLTSLVTTAGTKVAGNIGRRGEKKEEKKLKAQMDGKAKQAVAGKGLPTYDRKPAFSRLRRRRGAAALADNLAVKGSSRLGGGTSTPGSAAGTGGSKSAAGAAAPSLFDRAAGNLGPEADMNAGNIDANANVKADAKVAEAQADQVNGAIAAAVAAGGGEDKKEKKTAKDIFNNMNRGHQMNNGRSGGGGGGGGGGTAGPSAPQQAGPTAQPKAPTNNFSSAPQATSSAPAPAPAQQPGVVAVPVQVVDASTFLKKDAGPQAMGGMPHLPSSDVQNKATERANKYLFKSQNEVDDASDRLEELKVIQQLQKHAEEKHQEHKDEK